MIEASKYTLVNCFDRFLYASTKKGSGRLTLLEVGSSDSFITELPVNFDRHDDSGQVCRIDALDERSNFGIVWRPYCNKFRWYSFKK